MTTSNERAAARQRVQQRLAQRAADLRPSDSLRASYHDPNPIDMHAVTAANDHAYITLGRVSFHFGSYDQMAAYAVAFVAAVEAAKP